MARNVAQRRYTRSVLLLSVAYMLILFGVVSFFRNGAPAGLSAYAAAILPGLPIVGIFVVMGRYLIEEQDEYLRMRVARQCLVATGFALSIATVWGFLENFGLAPRVDSYWAAILWFGGLGVGSLFNRITLGDGGC